jgi:hypothetical protein
VYSQPRPLSRSRRPGESGSTPITALLLSACGGGVPALRHLPRGAGDGHHFSVVNYRFLPRLLASAAERTRHDLSGVGYPLRPTAPRFLVFRRAVWSDPGQSVGARCWC